jgi:hypothetical protein
MIQNNAELRQSIEQMGRMYRALASMHAEIAPLNNANYQLFAEGPIDEIRKLRDEVDVYLGIREALTATSHDS